MRITCLIDHLGPGGAQRQLCMLASLLARRGMEVSVLTYRHADFFLPLIAEAGVKYGCIESRSAARRVFAVRRAIRRQSPDVVLAFLDVPCLYAELAGVPRRPWGLVVSERSAVPGSDRSRYRWLRRFHRLADYVTTNSHLNRLLIERSVPALRGRVVTVYNAVDLDLFHPGEAPELDCERGQLPAPYPSRPLQLVVAATYRAMKNLDGLVEGLAIARAREPSVDLRLDWYGRLPHPDAERTDWDAYQAALKKIQARGLADRVHLNPPSRSIHEVFRQADAVVLASLFEGLPNVICEAMACARPVLMSRVADAENLVQDGQNGLLFEPTSPEDIARALLQFAQSSREERAKMGQRSRQMAQRMFDPQRIADCYAEVLAAAAQRQFRPLAHWVPEIPRSLTAANT